MKDLTVFVLTHNRGEMLIETIDSILCQTCHDFQFVVSDNSSNDETKKILEERNLIDRFIYRKRDHEYSSLDHFNICLSEVNTNYFILFHDDDVMMPNMIELLYNEAISNSFVAIGTNSYFIRNHKYSKCKSLHNQKKNMILDKKLMVQQYCKGTIVPFPSYIYNKSMVDELKFQDDVGKYSDVTWLLRLCDKGNVLWLSHPLMYYRIHNLQDSKVYDIVNKGKLYSQYRTIIGENNSFIRLCDAELLYIKILTEIKEGKINKNDFCRLYQKSKKHFIKCVIKVLILKFVHKD